MRPWFEDDFAGAMAMSFLAMAGVDVEKRNRLEKRMVKDALDRCGFRVLPVVKTTESRAHAVEIVNEHGELLNGEEEVRMANAYQEVKKEYAQRLKAEKEARERVRLAEEARRKAEYDAIAAPYREERRKRRAAEFAKRQPKGTS
jgi:hypothetical protein